MSVGRWSIVGLGGGGNVEERMHTNKVGGKQSVEYFFGVSPKKSSHSSPTTDVAVDGHHVAQ